MKGFIERVEEVNPIINAVVAKQYASALEEARAVDVQLMQDPLSEELSVEKKPFLGVPLTVKEAFAWKGNCPSHILSGVLGWVLIKPLLALLTLI